MACDHYTGMRSCHLCDPCATCDHAWHGLPCTTACGCPGPWTYREDDTP